MKMSVTQRDKRLLLVLGTALMVVLFVRFAILPALSRADELQTEWLQAQQTKQEMETQISVLEWIDGAIETSKAKLLEANRNFYDRMSNDEVDDLVTGLVLRHGLEAYALQIEQAQPLSIDPYFASSLAVLQAATQAAAQEQAANSTDTAQAAEEAAEQETALPQAQMPTGADSNYVYTAVATCTVVGSQDDFISLLDDVEANYPALRVQRYALSETPYLAQDLTVATNQEFTITFYLFMCDKAGDTL